jgi:hypothetical protein
MSFRGRGLEVLLDGLGLPGGRGTRNIEGQ